MLYPPRRGLVRYQEDERRLQNMPTTTDRVTILKTVSIFAKAPDDILAEIASVLE